MSWQRQGGGGGGGGGFTVVPAIVVPGSDGIEAGVNANIINENSRLNMVFNLLVF